MSQSVTISHVCESDLALSSGSVSCFLIPLDYLKRHLQKIYSLRISITETRYSLKDWQCSQEMLQPCAKFLRVSIFPLWILETIRPRLESTLPLRLCKLWKKIINQIKSLLHTGKHFALDWSSLYCQHFILWFCCMLNTKGFVLGWDVWWDTCCGSHGTELGSVSVFYL